ncbi:MAG: CYTH and CHAD domain-containing protein [Propionibacteriaceae bacterium]|nr:CYTH and CHAD domain-containing protein [Propionibacteriaceae bacterium]
MTAEVERAFELAPGQDLPALPGLGDSRELALEATYYDTRHFALTRARHVLLRCVGGDDEGWHVKLPGGDVEHHAPLGAPRPPAELRALIEGPLAGQALLPMTRLRTVRRQAEPRGPGGGPWAPTQATIGRALGAAIEADDRRSAGPLLAADVVLDYLSVQLGTLQALEAGVLADQPDAVHRSWVATRRMRSALATFEPLFDRSAVRRLRAELAWHAVELGAPRDAEVLRDHLLSALDSIGVAESAPQRGEIAARLNGAHRAAHAELAETMATQRYDGLHELLAGWLADPGLTAAAGAPAVPLLHGLLDRARGRAAERYGRALADPWNMTGWHEARKAAKAVRYGAEAVVAAFGDRAGAHAAAWEAVTDALGEVQDSVVAREAFADRAGDPVVDALLAFQVGRGKAELARGRAALESALVASL